MTFENVTDQNTIVSPEGDMLFTALKSPVTITNKDGTTKKQYVQKLEIDQSTPEGAAFRLAIEEVNPKIIVQYQNNKLVTQSPNHFQVQGKSKYQPIIMDTEGNEITDVPRFDSRTDVGRASMALTLDAKNGCVYLHTVYLNLKSLQIEPKEELSDEDKAAAMKAARLQAAKLLAPKSTAG